MARGGSKRRRSDPKLERLSQVQLFSGCSKRELQRIAEVADEIDVPAGKTLIRQGDSGRECFVIVEGRASAAIRGKGRFRLGAGSCFGEMSLLSSAPRTATVKAETDMQLLVLGSRQFSALIADLPSVAERVMAALATRLRQLERAQPQH
jgi:CRP-like cAMP-binding protein